MPRCHFKAVGLAFVCSFARGSYGARRCSGLGEQWGCVSTPRCLAVSDLCRRTRLPRSNRSWNLRVSSRKPFAKKSGGFARRVEKRPSPPELIGPEGRVQYWRDSVDPALSSKSDSSPGQARDSPGTVGTQVALYGAADGRSAVGDGWREGPNEICGGAAERAPRSLIECLSSERAKGEPLDMRDEFDSWNEFGEVRVRRLPSPGIAAVLSVLLPGLGHVYAGRLAMGAIWFLAVSFGYWAILVPGLLLHVISIWAAYRVAEEADR